MEKKKKKTTMVLKYNQNLDVDQTFYGSHKLSDKEDQSCEMLTELIKEANKVMPGTFRIKVERTRYTVGLKFVIMEVDTTKRKYKDLVYSLAKVCDELEIRLKPMRTKIERE